MKIGKRMNSRNLWWQYLLPQHLLSRLVGKIANCSWPWLRNPLIKIFIKHYQVDMSQAQQQTFQTFNEFFTRALKPGVRPITEGEHVIASPVDGFISQFGGIHDNYLLQAKGFEYDLLSLLGGSAQRAAPFRHGQFMTLYLSPKDYHRIHMPVSGQLKEMVYVPGRLFSVNPSSVANIANLFARNERVVTIFETHLGPMALILVGAMIVASIETHWAGLVAPQRPRQIQNWDYTGHKIAFNKGEEMGRFQLGSTVIMLFANPDLRWSKELQMEMPIKLGQMLAGVHTEQPIWIG